MRKKQTIEIQETLMLAISEGAHLTRFVRAVCFVTNAVFSICDTLAWYFKKHLWKKVVWQL